MFAGDIGGAPPPAAAAAAAACRRRRFARTLPKARRHGPLPRERMVRSARVLRAVGERRRGRHAPRRNERRRPPRRGPAREWERAR